MDSANQLVCLKAVVADAMPELILNLNEDYDGGNSDDDDELLNYVTSEIWNADVLQSLPLNGTEEMTSKQRRAILQNSSTRLVFALNRNLKSLGCTKDDEESLAVCRNVIKEWWKLVEQPEEHEAAAARGGEEEADSDEEEESVPPGHCAMCLRYMPLTFHHLCPRMLHKSMLKKGLYTKQNINEGIDICRPCHSAIHHVFDHETMALKVNTLEKLMEDERVQRWVRYAEKQRTDSSRRDPCCLAAKACISLKTPSWRKTGESVEIPVAVVKSSRGEKLVGFLLIMLGVIIDVEDCFCLMISCIFSRLPSPEDVASVSRMLVCYLR
ncbi:hypothetical protein R1flu_028419 [Riccia fluitans]|uniref:Uncharacterized protein n=1 Tax=Riccia fluitans TaxID=41844 RepID=A0ABD1XLM4_9MARC